MMRYSNHTYSGLIADIILLASYFTPKRSFTINSIALIASSPISKNIHGKYDLLFANTTIHCHIIQFLL